MLMIYSARIMNCLYLFDWKSFSPENIIFCIDFKNYSLLMDRLPISFEKE